MQRVDHAEFGEVDKRAVYIVMERICDVIPAVVVGVRHAAGGPCAAHDDGVVKVDSAHCVIKLVISLPELQVLCGHPVAHRLIHKVIGRHDGIVSEMLCDLYPEIAG